MILRIACVLAIVAQLILLVVFLRPTGYSAIAYSFVGNPLLGVAVLMGLLWWWRHGKRADTER